MSYDYSTESKRSGGKRKKWTSEENDSIKQYFAEEMAERRLPKKLKCEEYLKQTNSSRLWSHIKDRVRYLTKEINDES